VNLPILIDKEQTILRKNTLIALNGNVEPRGGETPHNTDKGVNFLLCPSCFWCASSFSPDFTSLEKCPRCIEGNIEITPIAENEKYRFNNDTQRGITMEFLR
jgi:hypothetical protein